MALPASITAVHNDLYVIEVAADPLNAGMTGRTLMGFGTVVEGPGTSPIVADGTFVWFAREADTPCLSHENSDYYFVAGSAILFTETAIVLP
jgi:hypothetical protein